MIVIQGICYDEKSSFMKGPALAPPLIREQLWSEAFNSYSELGVQVIPDKLDDRGNFKVKDYWDIYQITKENLARGNKILTWGGDHSITYPIVKAIAEWKRGFDILHIDAHADLYHEFEGDPYSHACPFARIMEDKLVHRLVQVGIRTLTDHQRAQAEKYGVEIIEMKHLSNRLELEFSRPLYISLDIDAFDPAFAPGVSHQESGGMNTREVLSIIHNLSTPIIGADVVEFNPIKDHAGITASLCGKMSKEILGQMLTPY